MEHNGTCRMKMNESYNLTTNGIVGTSCRLQTFRTSLLGLFNRARAVHLWILVARKWQQDATHFWRFAAIFMLFPPRVQRCWRKDWKIIENHKHSQTSQIFPNHLHPNPSTNIHLHPRILPSSLSAMSTLRLHILWRNLLGFRRHAVVVHLCHLMKTRNVLNPWHDIAQECWGGKSIIRNDG